MGQLHNELRRAGLIQESYRRIFGATEAEWGVERFGETLQPVFDLWGEPAWALLRGELLIARRFDVAAGVGLVSHGGIRNPVGSGMIVTVDLFHIETPGNGTILMDTTLPAGATTAGCVSRDSRSAGIRSVVANVEHRLAAVTGDPVWRQLGGLPLAPPFVLAPGSQLWAEPEANNTAITGIFAARQRRALPGELD